MIGTKHEVVQCRVVGRLGEFEGRSAAGVLELTGTAWEFILGRRHQHIPVDVADNDDHMGPDSENEEAPVGKVDDDIEEKEFRITVNIAHVSRKAI